MKTKSATLSSILLGTCLMTLVSCGSDGGGSGSSENSREEARQDDQGIYRAVLKPLNKAIAGDTTGTIEIRIEGDDFIVESNVVGAPSGVKHFQNIMVSNSCPDAFADVNGDSVIDVREAMAKTGDVLIPLDSRLSEQLAGMDYGPISNGAGRYVYKRSSTLTEVLADLRSPDPDKFDSIVKLPFGQNLNLSGKVVVVHGVKSGTALAETVATIRDLPMAQTVPIACGKLVRVNSEDPTPEVMPEPDSSTEEESTTTDSSGEEDPVEDNPSASTETSPEVTI